MAREFAQNRLSMWNDDDFRTLTSDAQNLYNYLLAHPTTTYAGVVDWRPARLQAVNSSWTAADVEAIGDELEAGHYIVVDRETEEACIRSFLRWESVLKSPNLARAVAKAFDKVQSRLLRGVIAFEVQRLQIEEPDWAAWDVDTIGDILDVEGINAKDRRLPETLRETLPETLPATVREEHANPSDSGRTNPSPITSNQITSNREPITLQQSTRTASGADDEESIEALCRRQVEGAFGVDFDKVRVGIGKACGRVPDATSTVRIVASVIARASETPKNPTAFVLSSVKNNWAEWQQMIDEAVA